MISFPVRMTIEIDRVIRDKYRHSEELDAQIKKVQQQWDVHESLIASLPPVVKPIVSFLDGFRSLKDDDKVRDWRTESYNLRFELDRLIRSNPGKYELTHLAYNPASTRWIFPPFSYGFIHRIGKKTFPKLFMGSGIVAKRAEVESPLLEIRTDKNSPLLHLPDGFAFVLKKHKDKAESSLDPEGPVVAYSAWQPQVTDTPKPIRIPEDIAIPWKSSLREVKPFKDTEAVPKYWWR